LLCNIGIECTKTHCSEILLKSCNSLICLYLYTREYILFAMLNTAESGPYNSGSCIKRELHTILRIPTTSVITILSNNGMTIELSTSSVITIYGMSACAVWMTNGRRLQRVNSSHYLASDVYMQFDMIVVHFICSGIVKFMQFLHRRAERENFIFISSSTNAVRKEFFLVSVSNLYLAGCVHPLPPRYSQTLPPSRLLSKILFV
jgi:hypothetical protein